MEKIGKNSNYTFDVDKAIEYIQMNLENLTNFFDYSALSFSEIGKKYRKDKKAYSKFNYDYLDNFINERLPYIDYDKANEEDLDKVYHLIKDELHIVSADNIMVKATLEDGTDNIGDFNLVDIIMRYYSKSRVVESYLKDIFMQKERIREENSSLNQYFIDNEFIIPAGVTSHQTNTNRNVLNSKNYLSIEYFYQELEKYMRSNPVNAYIENFDDTIKNIDDDLEPMDYYFNEFRKNCISPLIHLMKKEGYQYFSNYGEEEIEIVIVCNVKEHYSCNESEEQYLECEDSLKKIVSYFLDKANNYYKYYKEVGLTINECIDISNIFLNDFHNDDYSTSKLSVMLKKVDDVKRKAERIKSHNKKEICSICDSMEKYIKHIESACNDLSRKPLKEKVRELYDSYIHKYSSLFSNNGIDFLDEEDIYGYSYSFYEIDRFCSEFYKDNKYNEDDFVSCLCGYLSYLLEVSNDDEYIKALNYLKKLDKLYDEYLDNDDLYHSKIKVILDKIDDILRKYHDVLFKNISDLNEDELYIREKLQLFYSDSNQDKKVGIVDRLSVLKQYEDYNGIKSILNYGVLDLLAIEIDSLSDEINKVVSHKFQHSDYNNRIDLCGFVVFMKNNEDEEYIINDLDSNYTSNLIDKGVLGSKLDNAFNDFNIFIYDLFKFGKSRYIMDMSRDSSSYITNVRNSDNLFRYRPRFMSNIRFVERIVNVGKDSVNYIGIQNILAECLPNSCYEEDINLFFNYATGIKLTETKIYSKAVSRERNARNNKSLESVISKLENNEELMSEELDVLKNIFNSSLNVYDKLEKRNNQLNFDYIDSFRKGGSIDKIIR